VPLKVPGTPERYFVELRKRLGIRLLPVHEEVTAQLIKLPNSHRDPFNRLLICQSIEHGLILIMSDTHVSCYSIHAL